MVNTLTCSEDSHTSVQDFQKLLDQIRVVINIASVVCWISSENHSGFSTLYFEGFTTPTPDKIGLFLNIRNSEKAILDNKTKLRTH